MKTLNILLAAVLCIGLLGASGLIGCGGDDKDDCETACDKAYECDANIPGCVTLCQATKCATNCDTDAGCDTFADCVERECIGG